MTEETIAGTILVILGGIYVVRPDLAVRFQVWTQKVIMGANYEPSTRTYRAIRIIGVFVLLLGLLVLAGVIK